MRGVPSTTRHGTNAGYVAGCRQDCCRRAHGRRMNRYRARLAAGEHATVPAIGTRRRLQALAALGWSQREIARRLDVTQAQVHLWATDTGPTFVLATTAAPIAALYEQLCMTPGPAARTRAYAAAAGWAPPLAWDDDIDDPAARPDLGAKAHSLDLDEWCHLVSLHVNPDEAARRCGVKDVNSIEMAATRHGHARALRWLAALTLDRPMQDGQGRETVDILKARAARLRRLADEAGAAA